MLGLASVVLTGVWMGHYRGGFAWDGSGQEFNVHPLCMVLGLVFLHGDGEPMLISHHDSAILFHPVRWNHRFTILEPVFLMFSFTH